MSDHLLLVIAWVLLISFAILSALVLLVLTGFRVGRRALQRRSERLAASVRTDVLDAVLNEDDASTAARQRLLATRGRARNRVEDELIGLLPRISGDAHERTATLLRRMGAERSALRRIRSRSVSKRCSGAFGLGALESRTSLPVLLDLLNDRSFDVRRVAARALGGIGDPDATEPLLRLVRGEPEMARDVGFALARIGEVGSATLREALSQSTASDDVTDRSGPLVADVLGQIGDLESVGVLSEAVRHAVSPTAVMAAESLALLEMPTAVPALLGGLSRTEPEVRRAAAAALGRLGESEALTALVSAVADEDPAFSRVAASALADLGPDGLAALEQMDSAYAVEAVALARLAGRGVH